MALFRDEDEGYTPEQLEGSRKLDEHIKLMDERTRQDQIRLNQYQRDRRLPVTKFKAPRSIEQEELLYYVKVGIGILIVVALLAWCFRLK